MAYRKGGFWVVSALLLALLVCVEPAHAGFLDDLKEATEEAKEKWRESEEERGELKEKLKEAAERAREKWRETADDRRELKRKLRETVDTARQKWRDSEPERRELIRKLRESAEEAKVLAQQLREEIQQREPEIRAAWERASEWAAERKRNADRLYELARYEYGPRIAAAIRDPENQRKALETVGALIEVRRQFRRAKYETSYAVLKLAAEIPVDTEGGRKTLGEAARERLLNKCPWMAGTPLDEDPVAPLAHLIAGDRRYFISELPLVESNGRRVPIKEAMLECSSFDPDKALLCLSIAKASEDVADALVNGDGAVEAMGSVLTAIEVANRE